MIVWTRQENVHLQPEVFVVVVLSTEGVRRAFMATALFVKGLAFVPSSATVVT